MSLTKKLSVKHEEDVHEWLGGHMARSSGNQYADQADGRRSRYRSRFGFAWDCKAAMPGTKSMSVTREMLDKLQEQAHGERPMLPMRFYDSDRGHVEHDWVAIKMDDLREMLDALDQQQGDDDG